MLLFGLRPGRSREACGQRRFEDTRFRNLRQVSLRSVELMASGSTVATACSKLQGAVLSLFLLRSGTASKETPPLPRSQLPPTQILAGSLAGPPLTRLETHPFPTPRGALGLLVKVTRPSS